MPSIFSITLFFGILLLLESLSRIEARGLIQRKSRQGRKKRLPKSRFDVHKKRTQDHNEESNLNKLYPEQPLLRPDEMTSLCILGITGGLGSQLAKDALQSGRHRVMGIVRSLEKANRVFSLDELRNIQLVQGSIGNDTATNDEAFLKNTFDLFRPDILVEVKTSSFVIFYLVDAVTKFNSVQYIYLFSKRIV